MASDKSLLPNYASEFLENTCLGTIGHQVSAPEFPVAAVDQAYDHTII